jgi:hypothetical protein
MPRRRAAAVLALVFGCSSEDVVAILPTGSGMPGQSGPCDGATAMRTFAVALCTCQDYINQHGLIADAFDSRQGPYAGGRGGGSIGVDGRIDTSETMTIGGTLTVGDIAGIHTGAGANLAIAGDLEDGGALIAQGTVDVGGACSIGGTVMAQALRVSGPLVVAPGYSISVTGPDQYASLMRSPVQVTKPCPCGASDLVDAAAIVAAHRAQNDDAASGLSPDALAAYAGPLRFSIPSGAIYLSKLSGHGDLVLAVDGESALYVDGDLLLDGALRVALGAKGTLDIYITGGLHASASLDLGDKDAPSRVRLYIAGTAPFQLDQGGVIGASVYAPNAEMIVMGSGLEVFGALFLRRVAGAQPITLHADIAVLTADGTCP